MAVKTAIPLDSSLLFFLGFIIEPSDWHPVGGSDPGFRVLFIEDYETEPVPVASELAEIPFRQRICFTFRIIRYHTVSKWLSTVK